MHRAHLVLERYLAQRRLVGARDMDVLVAKEASPEIEPIPRIVIAADEKYCRRKR